MMYPYMILADETEIVHSQIIEKDGMGEYRLPKLFMVSGYTVYFWSNENGEPICAKWKQAFVTDEIKFYC